MHTQSLSQGCARRVSPVWRDAPFYPGVRSCRRCKDHRTSCSSSCSQIWQSKLWLGKNDQDHTGFVHSEIPPDLFEQTDLSIRRRWGCTNVHGRPGPPVSVPSPNVLWSPCIHFAAPAGGCDVFYYGFSVGSYGIDC